MFQNGYLRLRSWRFQNMFFCLQENRKNWFQNFYRDFRMLYSYYYDFSNYSFMFTTFNPCSKASYSTFGIAEIILEVLHGSLQHQNPTYLASNIFIALKWFSYRNDQIQPYINCISKKNWNWRSPLGRLEPHEPRASSPEIKNLKKLGNLKIS